MTVVFYIDCIATLMIFQLFLHLLNVQLWNDMNSEKN